MQSFMLGPHPFSSPLILHREVVRLFQICNDVEEPKALDGLCHEIRHLSKEV